MKFKSGSNTKNIEIKGARVHNLKNIDVQIKRNKVTVVTGVSGSGKSSLVFDTLYAEGQRRYVESLSAYARQFLGKMNKPEVDYIHGISPAIAIEQKVNTRNPRSTVATTTEIYDYLKLLFARVGITFSPISGNPVIRHTVDIVVDEIEALPVDTRVLLLVKITETGTDLKKKLEVYLQSGFNRLLVDGEIVQIEDFTPQAPAGKSKPKSAEDIHLLIDRFTVTKGDEDNRNRIADSVQTAFFEGHGECETEVWNENGTKTRYQYNNRFELDGMTFEEPSVNFFSFNNPYGACKTCEGFGSVIGIDEDLVVPDKSLSIYADAVAPWKGEKMSEWKAHFVKLSTKNKFPIHKPYHELTAEQRDLLWRGEGSWEGIDGFFKEIERQTYKIQYRVMLARYRGKTGCPDCKGTRLRKDANYVKLVDQKSKDGSYKSISDIILMSIDTSADYFSNLALNKQQQKIADRMLVEITSRLSFLQNVGLGYLSLNRLSNSLSGGESQRINLATSLGSSLVGSLYILDEPSIGLHSRDTEKLITVLEKLRDIGNTVVVVEHDQDIMEVADDIIDIGPFAGVNGGELIAQGTVAEIKKDKNSLTGKYLSEVEKVDVPLKRRKWSEYVEVKGARQNNLKGIDVKFPLHIFSVITGVSGSGKTTLVKSILFPALQKQLGNYTGEKTGVFDKLEGNLKSVNHIEMV
ncbi:MAG: excinuclease ABC subunit A, partial [Bacteroidota bacterium]